MMGWCKMEIGDAVHFMWKRNSRIDKNEIATKLSTEICVFAARRVDKKRKKKRCVTEERSRRKTENTKKSRRIIDEKKKSEFMIKELNKPNHR